MRSSLKPKTHRAETGWLLKDAGAALAAIETPGGRAPFETKDSKRNPPGARAVFLSRKDINSAAVRLRHSRRR